MLRAFARGYRDGCIGCLCALGCLLSLASLAILILAVYFAMS